MGFPHQWSSMTTSAHHACQWLETQLLKEISSQSLDGESPQTPPEVSPLSSEWCQTFPLSPTVIAMTFTELLDPELSALTPLEERDLAMEILVDLVTKAGMTKAGQAWNQV